MPRVSIPVDERLKAEVAESPELFGLDAGLSETRRLAHLVKVGAEALRAQVYEQRRRELYAELVAEPAYRESAEHLSELAREHDIL